MRRHYITAIGVIILLNITACKKQNEETLINNQGGPAPCDTVGMKYSVNIQPIIQNNCYSCHQAGNQLSGIALDDYAHLKVQADNNNLISVITHAPGYPPMPDGLPKLSDCDINKIADWISSGAPNN